MQDKVFSLNLVLKYLRLSSTHAWTAKQDRSEPDHVRQKQVLYCKLKTKDSRIGLVNWNSVFFTTYNVLKKDISEAGPVSILRKRSTKPGRQIRLSYSQWLGITEIVSLRYVPENRSSPEAVTGKWLLTNQRLITRLQSKTWTNRHIKTVRRTMNWTDQATDTTQKSKAHTRWAISRYTVYSIKRFYPCCAYPLGISSFPILLQNPLSLFFT